MSANPVILNYMDALLHQSDVELLKGPFWLNDNIITFYFEYLEKNTFKDEKNVLFISPEVVQCLKAAKKNELEIFLEPLNAQKRKFIFLALNNCEIMDRGGGSHWSLLAYSQPEETFFHFDSMSGSNHKQAVKLAGHLLSYLSPTQTGDYVEEETLQQQNSYDCGIFVLCHVDSLTKYCLQHNRIANCNKITEMAVYNMRSHVLNIIQTLQDEGY